MCSGVSQSSPFQPAKCTSTNASLLNGTFALAALFGDFGQESSWLVWSSCPQAQTSVRHLPAQAGTLLQASPLGKRKTSCSKSHLYCLPQMHVAMMHPLLFQLRLTSFVTAHAVNRTYYNMGFKICKCKRLLLFVQLDSFVNS